MSKNKEAVLSCTMYQFVCLVLFFCSLATCQSSCSSPFEILPPYNNVSVVSIISSSNNGVYQCGNNGGATYWLQIYPQNSEPITLSTCNPDTYFNPIVSAYISTSTSDPCGHLQCLNTISSNKCLLEYSVLFNWYYWAWGSYLQPYYFSTFNMSSSTTSLSLPCYYGKFPKCLLFSSRSWPL